MSELVGDCGGEAKRKRGSGLTLKRAREETSERPNLRKGSARVTARTQATGRLVCLAAISQSQERLRWCFGELLVLSDYSVRNDWFWRQRVAASASLPTLVSFLHAANQRVQNLKTLHTGSVFHRHSLFDFDFLPLLDETRFDISDTFQITEYTNGV